MKGKFIVIEGTDGSGKTTQLKLLQEWLKKNNFKYKIDDYPHYQTTVWGQLCGRVQMGEFGDPTKITPYLTCLPYMIDEYFGGLQIKEWVKQGNLVLSNRYFTSNVHQIGKLSGRARNKFREWLWDAGWNKMGIYKPDLVMVLYLPPKLSMKLSLKKGQREYTKGKRTDLVERNYQYQKEAAKEYLRMCRTQKNWVLVKCFQRGKILSPQKIHQKIITILKEREIFG